MIRIPLPPFKPRRPFLYRAGDTVGVCDGDPPGMTTVAAVRTSRVNVPYTKSDGMMATGWSDVPFLEQVTISPIFHDLSWDQTIREQLGVLIF